MKQNLFWPINKGNILDSVDSQTRIFSALFILHYLHVWVLEKNEENFQYFILICNDEI